MVYYTILLCITPLGLNISSFASWGDIFSPSGVVPAEPRANSKGARRGAGMQRMLDKVPSAVFEKGIRGVREYSVGARAACIGVKFLEYSLAGMACGLIGQGIANSAMMARRAGSPDGEFAVDPPPLLKTALVWGLFMGASSNLRYQAVFGLERLVDGTIARRVPQVRRSLLFFVSCTCHRSHRMSPQSPCSIAISMRLDLIGLARYVCCTGAALRQATSP